MKRYLPIIIILICMAVVYFTGVYKYLSLEYLKMHYKSLEDYLHRHPISTPIVFILIYIASTALSIPGGIFLTLLGGFLFPQPLSSIYVIFSATCGATIIFLAAKTAFGQSLKQKAGPFLKKMEKGFSEDAVSYLLFLRLVPIFPFWIVNIAPAFFNVSLWTYVWTTVIGIAPGTIVFTLAGGGLEKIFETDEHFSFNSIFNIQLKIALTLLGLLTLLPMLIKKIKKKKNEK